MKLKCIDCEYHSYVDMQYWCDAPMVYKTKQKNPARIPSEVVFEDAECEYYDKAKKKEGDKDGTTKDQADCDHR